MDESDKQFINNYFKESMEEHKLTMSFINGNPGFVVKADNSEELDELLKTALPIFKKFKVAVDTYREKQMNDATPPPGQDKNPPTCGIHGTKMIWKTGKYKNTTSYHKMGEDYAFWSCPTKNANGSYCKFKV